MDYKKAGVDIEAGYKAVELIKKHVQDTMRPEVLGGIGGFSGAFSLKSFMHMENPTLVCGTDGVGTKLKLAFLLDKHDTVGIDCVAMCVNDIACDGGEPLFFLDYIACGKNVPERIAEIVKGVAKGCTQAGAALIGGETAEMPGFYKEDEYDLAGFAVGIVDEHERMRSSSIDQGDILIGIASSGIHSNGFSLVRKVFNMNLTSLERTYEDLGTTLGQALLEPTKIYVQALKEVKDRGIKIKGCSHITGGGFYENIPRMLPHNIKAKIKKESYELPPIFQMLKRDGNLEEEMMYHTFNMGIGMVLAVSMEEGDKTIKALREAGEVPYFLGEIVPGQGEKGVELC
ncbi:MAG: phosphoribosylformylglycinamidine cyclo-ligase [Lachnospiraceae bacterium]|jgi:phosphoribosylformylglycinamidine cyclo-ligase|nr:phosphoribosylformylglycinamidine cyclo-ligase [Lachnospiraceae bacterium]